MVLRMTKMLGWILTTLLIPVVVFAYQRFAEDIRTRQTIETELTSVEFELAMRLGQASGSFFSVVDWKRAGPGAFQAGVTVDWLQSIVLAFRHKPIVNVRGPISGARILVAPVATAKDLTLLGLLARGMYLQRQMLDFLEQSFTRRVLFGYQIPDSFCLSPEREKAYLANVARRMKWPDETPVEQRKITLEQWRPSITGANNTETACLKTLKYRAAISALLNPDTFASELGSTGQAV